MRENSLSSEIRRPTTTRKNVAHVMMPRQPSCTRHMSTVCPKQVRSRPTSITVSPVMHTAEHDVNRASIGRIHVCEGDEIGNMKRKAPSRIAPRKPNTISQRLFIYLLSLPFADSTFTSAFFFFGDRSPEQTSLK